MNKKIKVMMATYKHIQLSAAESRRIRGFFADLDQKDSHLHNHMEDGTQIYRYPLVQYKVIRGNPVILAAEEGIRSIHPHLMEQKKLTLGDREFTDLAMDIHLAELPVGDSRIVRSYRFTTPWLALNQENYGRYQKAGAEERDALLGRILIGNLLSLCKGFQVTVEQPLQVTHQLKEIPVTYKGKKMSGFTGTFQVNCCIPELCGIGKGTARGFGTIQVMKSREEER